MLVGLTLFLHSILLLIIKRPVDDETDPTRCRVRRTQRRKGKVIKLLWLATASLVVVFPLIQFAVTLGLFTTFLSFTILDETP